MAAGATGVFVAAAVIVVLATPVPGDRAAVEAVVDGAGTRLDTPAEWTGRSATAWVLVPVAASLGAWAVVRHHWGALTVTVGAAVLVWVVNPLLKQVFARERPGVRGLVEPTSQWSFPAGHAVASAAWATLAVVLAWPTRARWPVTVLAIAYVALVGASRLVLGVHFPSDLVAGWALAVGAVTGLAACLLARGPAPGPDSAP